MSPYQSTVPIPLIDNSCSVASVSGCQALLYSLGVFFIISLPSTSLLFFLRLRAVFSESKVVVYLFGVLWLAVLAVSPLYMVNLQGCKSPPLRIKPIQMQKCLSVIMLTAEIPFTRRCNITFAEEYSVTPLILASLHDTFIFFAISFRLVVTSVEAVSFRTGLQTFFQGRGLHNVSKSLLQSGQIYYGCAHQHLSLYWNIH